MKRESSHVTGVDQEKIPARWPAPGSFMCITSLTSLGQTESSGTPAEEFHAESEALVFSAEPSDS